MIAALTELQELEASLFGIAIVPLTASMIHLGDPWRTYDRTSYADCPVRIFWLGAPKSSYNDAKIIHQNSNYPYDPFLHIHS